MTPTWNITYQFIVLFVDARLGPAKACDTSRAPKSSIEISYYFTLDARCL